MKYSIESIRAVDTDVASELDQIKSILLFTALTTIGAKVYIPHEPVPFTLQTLFVVLSGAFLGWRNGMISMLLYLLIGAAGIPIFAGAGAGLPILFGSTAGYLFGFVISALVVGVIIDYSPSLAWTVISMFAGFLIIFTCGTVYLNAAVFHNWQVSVTQGFLIFSYWDLVKLVSAVAIYRTLSPRFKQIQPEE
ncbi:MAG TPA: biotin transporter BioY [Candidatus Kryptonia bacterium]